MDLAQIEWMRVCVSAGWKIQAAVACQTDIAGRRSVYLPSRLDEEAEEVWMCEQLATE